MLGILKGLHGVGTGHHRLPLDRAERPKTYASHPFSGSRLFRQWVGGRWEHWVYCTRNQSLDEVYFWIRTGDGVHVPHLRPGAAVRTAEVENWAPSEPTSS